MMFNSTRQYQVKYSKQTNEENLEQVGSLEEVATVPSSGSTQGLSKSLNLPTLSNCYFCPTIRKHKADVNKAIKNGNSNTTNTNYKDIPFCTIKTPIGEKPLNIEVIEEMYMKSFPMWGEDLQCFPEGPIFYGRLSKKEPFTRAIDIEEKLNQLRNKIQSISKVPFDVESDSDNDIISKTVNIIMENLQDLIKYLNLENNSRMENGLRTILSGMVKDNLTQKQDDSLSIAAILEIQHDIFEKVIMNNKTCREQKGYYEMR